jgi:hypothetical protein
MRRRWWWLLLVLVLFAVIGCIAVPVANHILYSPKTFDAENWRAGNPRQRARMVADLRWSGILPGKSRAEVIQLLGPPDRESARTLEYDYIHGSLVGDWLELPFANWREWLWIKFDAGSDRVSRLELRD